MTPDAAVKTAQSSAHSREPCRDRPIRWALLDGWKVFHSAVERLLRPENRLEWVGSFASAREALDTLSDLEPDVVLMDIELPDIDGIECISRLKALHPSIEILILTAHDHPEAVIAAFRAGATGYLVKSAIGPSRELIRDAILDVRRGGFPLSDSSARRVLDLAIQFPVDAPDGGETGLTPLEEEVLSALARGCRYPEIEKELKLSRPAVLAHIAAIHLKIQGRFVSGAVHGSGLRQATAGSLHGA
ncbi:MAG: hypothetical protein RIT19_1649 [Verrucomicrobiota bacterium]